MRVHEVRGPARNGSSRHQSDFRCAAIRSAVVPRAGCNQQPKASLTPARRNKTFNAGPLYRLAKGISIASLTDCHCFVLRPGAVQFLTQVVEIFPVLNRVFRLRFPGVQQRDQSLDFLELTRHSFKMFLLLIPLGEIMFSGLAHKMLVRKRTREFQPRPFCVGIFLPATRSRTARRNFSRSAGLSASSLRFIASATVLA